jgi:lipopolysaccharide export system permease protein
MFSALFGSPTLALYLGKRFARAMLIVFMTVFALIYMLDFVELIRRTSDVPNATSLALARLSLMRTPAIAEQVFPFAVLFGAMLTLLDLSRKLELVIARAAGLSAWQFLLAPLVVALVFGVIIISIYNPVSARLKEKAASVEAQLLGKSRANELDDVWIRQKSVDGQAIIRAGSLDVIEARIAPATFFIFDLDNTFMQRVEASEAFLKDGYWLATKAKVIIPGNEPEMHDTFQISSNLSRQQIKQSYAAADSIPFWSLPDYIRTTEMAGLDTTRYKQQYQTLMARPVLFVAMVLIAASVSLRFFRFGGVARMVLAGVAAGFLLYIATKLIEDLGGAGILSTTAAAWLPSIIGGLLGTLALLYQEDG